MPRPFEIGFDDLQVRVDEMVDATFADLQSQFLVLPRGDHFVDYADFQSAYEMLKRHTDAFGAFTADRIWNALREDALAFLVVRTILGLSPPEWADLARSDLGVEVPQNMARDLDVRCRHEREVFARLTRPRNGLALDRAEALVAIAVDYISRGAPAGAADTVHRLAKIDTADGLVSLRHAASEHVPYAVLLYERYLGRPFASHRDSVSELVGDVMESAVEERLHRARITFRKTKRAERIPGFEQAPDFLVPTELAAAAVIEAKITGDDGTARDKVTRIEKLAAIRDERLRAGQSSFEVIACIDGRGFGVRREDMRRMLLRTDGKVFTLATLDQLIPHTRLREFLPIG
ncbi:MAG: hypothetical protein IT176_05530 [Acidobacteria bacterium]|nr:hypothetical protein [Acidobacteriota bacterium]